MIVFLIILIIVCVAMITLFVDDLSTPTAIQTCGLLAVARPETREAWMNQRIGGITATEVRDWPAPAKRRQIIEQKVTRVSEDLSHIPAVNHGNLREPVIGEWMRRRFGIQPCDHVFSRADNVRHLASPDGISVDPITNELIVASTDAVLAEIKTSKHDLTPGTMDALRVLLEITAGSAFDRAGYYVQMQWQMYVMNANMTLFIYERRSETMDEATGTFEVLGIPEFCWIPRDDALIAKLVERADGEMLPTIDAARAAVDSGIPPVSPTDVSAEIRQLTADLLQARTAEATAKKAKEQAWEKLQAIYMAIPEGAETPEDQDIDLGFARITVNTTTKPKMVYNKEAAEKRAPGNIEKYNALVKRNTKPVDQTNTTFTITAKKVEGEK